MAGNGKRHVGAGIVVAGMLALATAGIFGHHSQTTVSPKQDFTAAATATAPAAQPVARQGWDYTGADDPAAFKAAIGAMARGKTAFVMFHDPDCPHCQDLTADLHQIQDQHLSKLDFDVVRVDIYRYPALTGAMMQGQGVPETHVWYGDTQPVFFSGTPDTLDPLLKLMTEIKDWRAHNAPAAAYSPAPAAPGS